MSYPEVKALIYPPKKLIVFVHGLGSNGDDLIDLVPFLQKDLPEFHFISPHGIEPYDMAPFGRQWFSLKDRSSGKISKLIAESAPKLHQIIQNKQQQLNLTNADTILVGFSQGSMLSLHLTLTTTQPFACTIGFSGVLIAPPKLINKVTPICLIHGNEDDVVPISATRAAKKYLDKGNILNQTYEISNLKHSINAQGLNFAVNFIKSRI